MPCRILQLKFALWMIATLTLASCSQEEFADKGTSLPYGKYPLELTAAIGEAVATPATRGTVHGTFPKGYTGRYKTASSIEHPGGDGISWLSIFGSTYQIIDRFGTMALDENPIYWRRNDEIIYIFAYSSDNDPNGLIPHRVNNDQSKEDNFNNSDYLFAYEELTFLGLNELHFRHITSKVTINLTRSDYLDKQGAEGVEVSLTGKDGEKWYTEGRFNVIKSNPVDVTLFEEEGLQKMKIIPYKNPNPGNNDIYATYEAVVIPQMITGTGKTIQIKVGETAYSYEVRCPNDKYTSGEEWIYNITVDAKGLNVTVEEGNIGWEQGNTGSGEVELPKTDI